MQYHYFFVVAGLLILTLLLGLIAASTVSTSNCWPVNLSVFAMVFIICSL